MTSALSKPSCRTNPLVYLRDRSKLLMGLNSSEAVVKCGCTGVSLAAARATRSFAAQLDRASGVLDAVLPRVRAVRRQTASTRSVAHAIRSLEDPIAERRFPRTTEGGSCRPTSCAALDHVAGDRCLPASC